MWWAKRSTSRSLRTLTQLVVFLTSRMVNVKGHLGYPVTSSQVSFPSSTGVADQFSAQETTFSMQLRFFILVGCAYVTWPLLKSWFCVKTCVPSSSPLRRTCLGPRKQLHWEAWRSQRLVVWWPWVWCLKRRSATWTSQVPAVFSHVCFIQFTNMLGHIAWDSSGVATDSMDFDVFGPRMWWSWRKYGIFRCLDQQIFVTAGPQKWTARLQNKPRHSGFHVALSQGRFWRDMVHGGYIQHWIYQFFSRTL